MREHPSAPRRERRRYRAAAVPAAGLLILVTAALLHRDADAPALPALDHVVVVVLENHSYSQVVGSPAAPYLGSLARNGADLTAFTAETHPSQPNYFAMFSGGTQGVTDNACPPPGSPFRTADLGSELIDAGRSWGSYNEGLPAEGSRACLSTATRYARKHNPWFSFGNVPASTGHTFAQWPRDFTALPTVAFVVPDLCHDIHDCPVRVGDTWLRDRLGAYAAWARGHNSVLIVTADEDDRSAGNRIPTVLYGAHVKTGRYPAPYGHYHLLRTIEDIYHTAHAGRAASARPITEVWN